MRSITYMPILKWRPGEQLALKKLNANNEKFIPVIEVVDKLSPAVFFQQVKESYNGPIYIDTAEIDNSNKSVLYSFINYAAENDVCVWPLIYANDLNTSFNKFTAISSQLAIKIPIPEDFEGQSYNDIFSFLQSNMNEISIDLFLMQEK